jgi:hypothetical protein
LLPIFFFKILWIVPLFPPHGFCFATVFLHMIFFKIIFFELFF